MCHQTVGLIAGEIEKRGITTVSISVLREVTDKVHPPRALCTPFALGYPLGKPNDAALQTRIIRQALALADHAGPPPVLVDFEETAGS